MELTYTIKLNELHEEIGTCSEILNKASRLKDARMRNAIFKHVGDYRQSLREQENNLKPEGN